MKLKFMTPRQASKDQHRLKEKIEKERIEKEEIKTAEGCLVAFVYKSDNNVVSKDWWRKFSYEQAFISIKQGSNSLQDNV